MLALFGAHLQLPLAPVFEPAKLEPLQHAGLTRFIEGVVPFIGIAIAYFCYYEKPHLAFIKQRLTPSSELIEKSTSVQQFFATGWGMDSLYDKTLVNPFKALATINKQDAVNHIVTAVERLSKHGYNILSWTQNGQLRRYGWVMACGAVIMIGIGVFK